MIKLEYKMSLETMHHNSPNGSPISIWDFQLSLIWKNQQLWSFCVYILYTGLCTIVFTIKNLDDSIHHSCIEIYTSASIILDEIHNKFDFIDKIKCFNSDFLSV